MFLALLACLSEPAGDSGSVLLARHPELLSALSLPRTNREGLPDPRGATALNCRWKEERRDGDRVEWRCGLPARAVNYWHPSTTRPPGLQMSLGGKPLPFVQRGDLVGPMGTFAHQAGDIYVVSAEPPQDLSFVWPQAAEDELALNLDTAGLEDVDFALRTQPLKLVHRHGLYLPAPAEAVFRVEVPLRGRLQSGVVLLSPAVQQGVRSDGATLVVELEHEGRVHELEELELGPRGGGALELDLERWGGQTVSLRFRTEPGETNTLDYVFLGEPTLYTPKPDPGRVAVVFIDTLRRDHLGLYGYERPVSPTLDALAEQSMVYDQARAPAPWTLPSGRAAVTGRHPDAWQQGQHMGRWFAEQGWSTGAVVGNTYMTGNFDGAAGWSLHRGEVSTDAREATDRALSVLEQHADRDLALLVHYMDAHLPYLEPQEHRLWAAPEPPVPLLGAWMEKDLKWAWGAHPLKREALREYVVDRYDQAIHYLDAELARLLEALGPDATVVVFADHGEEFWEHGEIGHGHALSEELLRVPLILRSPGVAPGRSDRPATLQDIVPTVMRRVGLEPPSELAGEDLLGPEDPARPIAVGTPLFGPSAVGVVADGHRWELRGTTEHLFDLAAPTVDLAEGRDLAPWRTAYEQALGRPLVPVLRVLSTEAPRSYLGSATPIVLRVPGGVARMWPRPGGSYRFILPEPAEEMVVTGRAAPAELFLVPTDPQAAVSAENATLEWTLRPEGGPPDERQLDEDLVRELEALGYIVE